jgi:hypothetical protein
MSNPSEPVRIEVESVADEIDEKEEESKAEETEILEREEEMPDGTE